MKNILPLRTQRNVEGGSLTMSYFLFDRAAGRVDPRDAVVRVAPEGDERLAFGAKIASEVVSFRFRLDAVAAGSSSIVEFDSGADAGSAVRAGCAASEQSFDSRNSS